MVKPHQSESASDFTREIAAKMGFCIQLPAMSRAKSLLFGVAGKLDNITNQWSNFAFALVWLDLKGLFTPTCYK